MPFAVSPDRLSPSGPFLPVGGVIRSWWDTTEEDIDYPALVDPGGSPVPILRSQLPDIEIRMTLTNFRPGNTLVFLHAVTWRTAIESDAGAIFFPALDIDGAGFLFVDNGTTLGFSEGGDAVQTAGMCAFRPDPLAVTQTPIVTFLLGNLGAGDVTIPGGPLSFSGLPGSAWFGVLELNEQNSVQLPPGTTLSPIPVL